MDLGEGKQSGKKEDWVVASQLVLLLSNKLVELIVRLLSYIKITVKDPWSIFFLAS